MESKREHQCIVLGKSVQYFCENSIFLEEVKINEKTYLSLWSCRGRD